MPEKVYYATGKRKTSIARVWMRAGDGKIKVNEQDLNHYFKLGTAKMIIFQPLELTGTLGQFDIDVTVEGGGHKGQAGAIRHGITRGLLAVKSEFRESLKKAGFITRDPRKKERKKYGQKGARKRFQFSKR
jgi:small subunit ribosomal protein S9